MLSVFYFVAVLFVVFASLVAPQIPLLVLNFDRSKAAQKVETWNSIRLWGGLHYYYYFFFA